MRKLSILLILFTFSCTKDKNEEIKKVDRNNISEKVNGNSEVFIVNKKQNKSTVNNPITLEKELEKELLNSELNNSNNDDKEIQEQNEAQVDLENNEKINKYFTACDNYCEQIKVLQKKYKNNKEIDDKEIQEQNEAQVDLENNEQTFDNSSLQKDSDSEVDSESKKYFVDNNNDNEQIQKKRIQFQ
jgi:hypothetical protein